MKKPRPGYCTNCNRYVYWKRWSGDVVECPNCGAGGTPRGQLMESCRGSFQDELEAYQRKSREIAAGRKELRQ